MSRNTPGRARFKLEKSQNGKTSVFEASIPKDSLQLPVAAIFTAIVLGRLDPHLLELLALLVTEL